MVKMRGARVALSLLALCAYVRPAVAQNVDTFFKGKSITLIVGSAPGGGYDTMGRAVARYLPAHLPGNPTVVVQNMPGAGGILAGNYLYQIAAKDGTVIGMINNTVPFEPMLGDKQATFDPNAFTWLGTPSVEVGLVILWNTVPVNSVADLRQHEVSVGSTGGESFFARILNETLGTKMRVITGYPGQNDAFLAMERGELDGYPSTFYSSLKSTRPDWLRDHKIKIILQYGPDKARDLPHIPFAADYVTSPDNLALMQVAFAALGLGRPFLAPPGIPGDRVTALRTALSETFADPRFIEDAKKLNLEVGDPRTGQQLQKLVTDAYDAPAAVTERLRRLAE
jgi:tripartite-type tricarboxylate transporter receptor subunit TctC